MAVKFLDYTGLGYFWSKIKAWCNATFAAITHNQASNTINAMTSYSKPSSGSAITTSDSLNTAIGKLEAKVDAVDDSSVVHKTGNEIIQGLKTFQNNHGDFSSQVIIKSTDIVKGTPIAPNRNTGVVFADNTSNDPDSTGRLASVVYHAPSYENSTYYIHLRCNNYYGSGDSILRVGYDEDNVPYAIAPETSTSRNERMDIITRGFLEDKGYLTSHQDISGKVDKSGDTMTGTLTIVAQRTVCSALDRSDTTTDSAPEAWRYEYVDANSLTLGNYGIQRGHKNGYTQHRFRVRNTGGKWADLIFTIKDDNTYQLSLAGGSGTTSNGFIGSSTSCTGNAATATKLATARTINIQDSSATNTGTGASFDGSGNATIKLPATIKASITGNCSGSSGSCTGNAATATKLGTSTVGSATKPIYLNGGSPTAVDSRVDLALTHSLANDSFLDIVQTTQGDKSNNRCCSIRMYNGNGYNTITLGAHNESDGAPSGIYVKNTNGTVTSGAPEPAADANDERIATTKWVKARGFLTSHQSLSNYVTLNGAQTISATKTFSANQKFTGGIERWGDNAHIKIFNTGLATYSTKPSSDKSGSLGIHSNDGNTSASFGFVQYSSGATDRAAYMRCYVSGSGSTYRSVNLNAGDNAFFPGVTKQLTLGRSDRLWTTVYAQTGSINTSDERQKQAIETIPDSVLDAWEELSWKQFKLNDSVEEKGFDKARLHTGLIAQHIDTVFKSHNLDASKYGLFCYDEWGESPAEMNDDNEIVSEPLPPGNQYSLRYEEALCVEAAYQRRKNKILENRISELERQVSDMLQILQSLKGAN